LICLIGLFLYIGREEKYDRPEIESIESYNGSPSRKSLPVEHKQPDEPPSPESPNCAYKVNRRKLFDIS
jgi:hypothetical protein